MKNTLRVVLAALASSALYFTGAPSAWSAEGITQSLRGADAKAEDQAFEEKAQLGKRPGSQKVLPRSYQQQPPLIPHATNNFDEITLEENQCLTCHSPETYKAKKATMVGKSHFLDPQTGKVTKEVSKARHNCVQCHVPQADATPLVDNTFKTVPQPQPKAR
jgi:nitrate reductase (cytochrome), electron transfer subunit